MSRSKRHNSIMLLSEEANFAWPIKKGKRSISSEKVIPSLSKSLFWWDHVQIVWYRSTSIHLSQPNKTFLSRVTILLLNKVFLLAITSHATSAEQSESSFSEMSRYSSQKSFMRSTPIQFDKARFLRFALGQLIWLNEIKTAKLNLNVGLTTILILSWD